MDFYLTEAVSPFHTAAGAAFNTFTTKKDVSPQPLPVILPDKVRKGSKLSIRAKGEYSTTGTPTFRTGFWFGTRAGTITGDIAVTGLVATPSAATAWPWELEWDGIVTATGASGTLLGQGKSKLGLTVATFSTSIPFPITAALRTVTGFDTTIERAIGVSAEWGTSNVANQIIVNDLRVLVMNGF